MKHIIDIKTWERKENYEFFLGFQNPTISILKFATIIQYTIKGRFMSR